MSDYKLLNQVYSLPDAAERCYDLCYEMWTAQEEIKRRFLAWYQECGSIQAVLKTYQTFSQEAFKSVIFEPLYARFLDLGIYDLSRDGYWARCIQFSSIDEALEETKDEYADIIDRQNEAAAERAARKASRGRWQGGGFGLSGALTGAMEAAALNAISGAGHSLVNAVGNAGSAIVASSAKGELYKSADTQNMLLNALIYDVSASYSAHIELSNEYKQGYYTNIFNFEKAKALFENGKNISEKREELLFQSFTQLPWYYDLAAYILRNYPEERENIYKIADRFHITFPAPVWEQLISELYDDAALHDEQRARDARQKILSFMRAHNISQSETLNKLDADCLTRLCSGYQVLDDIACAALLEKVKAYDALEANKAPFYAQLKERIHKAQVSQMEEIITGYETADEAACNVILSRIREHHALQKVKDPFIDLIDQRIVQIWMEELDVICQELNTSDEEACKKMRAVVQAHRASEEIKKKYLEQIQSRIEKIWSAEDGEIFDNLYMETDITDPTKVAEAIAYIKGKGRTTSTGEYLALFEACNEKAIKRARKYKDHIFKRFGLPLLIVCVGLAIIEDLPAVSAMPDLVGSILSTIIGCTFWAMIVIAVLASQNKNAWMKLTMKGKLIHPMIGPEK